MLVKFLLEFLVMAVFWLFGLISSVMPSFDIDYSSLLTNIISISSQARQFYVFFVW